jgi:ferric-dicitrate binding protein FerR (iron transport regulator)
VTKSSVILNPREKASLLNTGQLQVEEDVNMDNTKAWISNQLVFTSEPLVDVFKEIERQYNVKIHLPDNLSNKYTGSFEKMESVEKVLRSICRPFELQVHKADNNQFYISK